MKVEDELRSAILENNLLRDSERILLNTFDTLKMHYDAKKNKEEEIKEKRTDETFKCQKCSFKTDSKVRLKSHIDNIHEMHTCDACDYKTPFLANLNIHKEDVHNKSTHGRDYSGGIERPNQQR